MIDTVGPAPLWGAGSVPAGAPSATLVSTNSIVEDGNRAGNVATAPGAVGGATYYARLTNTAHDGCECGNPASGPILSVNDGTLHAITDWEVPMYAGRGVTDCPTPGGPVLSGYLSPGFTGSWQFGFTANYCNACGPILTDEQFTLDLWGPL